MGPLERAEYQGHTFTGMMRINLGERSRYSITPSAFYTQTLNKDIDSDSWDGGLYNYTDRGVGLDFVMLGLGFAGGAGTGSATVQYYHREYPNYTSLLDLATGLGVEEDEKDYTGVLVRAGYSWFKELGLSWTANYSMLYKLLDDKKVVDGNGFLTDDTQRDQLHTLDLSGWYLFDMGLKLGLGLNLGLNNSNQNYYDGMGTIPLDDDVSIPSFYDYVSYGVRPNISYTFGAFGLFPFTATYAFTFRETYYSDRLAKFSDSTYKPDKQEDDQQEHFFELRYDVNRRLSLIGRFQHLTNRSNNDDESVYRYDYKVYNYFAGVHLRY